MTGTWVKTDLLFKPSGLHPKLRSHAANPLALHLEGDTYRVFFSGRDSENRSSVGAVDINLLTREVVHEHKQPFLVHGAGGSFFEAGISIGNCYYAGVQRYMLFMGWQRPPGGHWRGDIGRIKVRPDLTLELDADVAFMASDEEDSVSLSYPWVEKTDSEKFRMWYGSTVTWDAGNGEMLHVIKSASSRDGHIWHKEGVAIPYEIGRAQAFSRPTVLIDAACGYRMWFSYRSGQGEAYRIGYSESRDGIAWILKLDQVGIDVSENGWDSAMIEYPYVFRHEDNTYMLYNGDGYGKTGFGLAVLDDNKVERSDSV
ncbi:hypothetical protein ELG83_02295 [Rhizobium leguminosarum]|uniref:Glycosyl hydrolase family 32 N-terminal domain-containing protein n=1 Tax=Rhizobium johnstonii (strain DSM 114642 / LMG 32736 / 3841) TaxID=216596 RepID=Q1ML62_RHIJ3|nr:MULTISPECIES: hypothetical protein [Rhizobium]NEI95941.1 hypothetical protein [Rhizobium leguminosarum]NEJ77464.1 hypothetical protein [Rhizobium leguminosarum]TBF38966.1 hypothetical protein ELG92_02290 [Rhizobium leguminosarum]TBF55339.1 hypothetical protein ELG87_02295 [Rhizobium leguminosarum]TBF71758.1 hypothetical protein ELG84_02290 [Rhizobium leguminosarum]